MKTLRKGVQKENKNKKEKKMSKTKRIVSLILSIVVLAGVGFGAFLLFGKKDNKLTEKRAIQLIGETTEELESAITTVGSAVAGEANSGSSNQLSASNALCSLDIELTSTKQEKCVEFLDRVKQIYSELEMVNYALNLYGTKMQLDQTYIGTEDGDVIYYCVSCEGNNVIFEYGFDKNDLEKIVIEYNPLRNIPSSISYFEVNKWFDDSEMEFEMSSINFQTEMYSIYSGGIKFPSTLTGDDLTAAYNTVEDKIVEGTSLKALNEYLVGLGEDYRMYTFQVFTGNIAKNIDSITFLYQEYDDVPEKNEDDIFKNYSSNIYNIEYFKTSKSNVDYNNAQNLTSILDDMYSVSATVRRQYAYEIIDNKFYFYSAYDLKDFDSKVLSKISRELIALGEQDEQYIDLKPIVEKLFYLYLNNDSNAYYVSILLGKCDYLELSTISAEIYNGKFDIYKDPSSNKVVVDYIVHIRVKKTDDSYAYYDLKTQLKEF